VVQVVEEGQVGGESFVERGEDRFVGGELELGLPLRQFFGVADVFEVNEDGGAGVVLVLRVAGRVVAARLDRGQRLAVTLGFVSARAVPAFFTVVTLSEPL
jgi:hypothetical protein